MPEDFDLDDYRLRYAGLLAQSPASMRGEWRYWHAGTVGSGQIASVASDAHELAGGPDDGGRPWREVRLELGCGKGAFAVGSALAQPDVLFVGLDVDVVCIAIAARVAQEAGARNAVFAVLEDGRLREVFDSGELTRIYLNFSTPYPKGRQAPLRLTHPSRLAAYHELLCDDGRLHLRTDNHALFDYSLAQLPRCGFEVVRQTRDARAEWSAVPQSGYEQRAVSAGATICAAEAVRVPVPEGAVLPQGVEPSASLYDYVPDDLWQGAYVPPEMQRGVEALRRTRVQMQRKGHA